MKHIYNNLYYNFPNFFQIFKKNFIIKILKLLTFLPLNLLEILFNVEFFIILVQYIFKICKSLENLIQLFLNFKNWLKQTTRNLINKVTCTFKYEYA